MVVGNQGRGRVVRVVVVLTVILMLMRGCRRSRGGRRGRRRALGGVVMGVMVMGMDIVMGVIVDES